MGSQSEARPGTIVTFYSYKGGTGRSMALANIAWILASNRKRVLMVDWDLEAPGLHRFFHPFVLDNQLRSSQGLMDMIWDFALDAMTPVPRDETRTDSQGPSADILQYAVSIDWIFPEPGRLDLIPAGLQDTSYSTKVSSFNWQNFYERLGGGAFLESIKQSMRAEYDYILVDSRTGLSDTAGICTVQMPDILLCCFTLSDQSVEGTAAVATSVLQQRGDGFRIMPIPMRVEDGEKQKLEAGRDYAQRVFAPFLKHLTEDGRDRYWGEVEIPYRRYYAYEEVLATVGDRPHGEGTLLAALERVARHMSNGDVTGLVPFPEPERIRLLGLFERGLPVEERHDFFISYAMTDAPWAQWIAGVLSQAGYSVLLDIWDPKAGNDWASSLATAQQQSQRVLAVVSPAFVTSPFAMEEAMRLVRADSRGGGRLIPVLVADVELPTPLNAVVAIDLTNGDEMTCQQLLLSGAAAGGFKPVVDPRSAQRPDRFSRPPFPPNAAASRNKLATLPRRETRFIGREDLLETIHTGFESGRDSNHATIQILCGIPGVGKTAIALEFAYRTAALYGAVLWMRAQRLGFDDLRSLDEMKQRMHSIGTRSLVIIDETDDPEILASLSLEEFPVDILITSRFGGWTVGQKLRVEALSLKDATTMLLASTGQTDQMAAEKVARAQGGLPLALVLSAGYITETGTSLSSYSDMVGASMAVVDRTMTTLRQAISEQIASVIKDSPAAEFVLRTCAFLDSAPIPVELFTEEQHLQLPIGTDVDSLGSTVTHGDRLALVDAIQALHRAGLLTRDLDSLIVNPLVQEAVRVELDPSTTASVLRAVLLRLWTALDRDPQMPASWTTYKAFAAHVLAASAHAESLSPVERIVGSFTWTELLLRVGRYLQLSGEFMGARIALERALEMEKPLGALAYRLPLIRAELAEVLRLQGELSGARTMFQQAWTDAVPVHVPVASSIGLGLDLVMRDQGDLLGARKALKATLHEYEGLLGSQVPEVARIRRELGVVMGMMGDPAAQQVLERALEQHQAVLGSHQPEVARDMAELGIVLRQTGQMVSARQVLEGALSMSRSLLGPEHPEVARDLRELAVLYRESGDLGEAGSMLEQAATIQQKVFGEGHLEPARTLRELGVTQRVFGNLTASRSTLERVLALQEANFGTSHLEVGATLVELARTQRDAGDLAGARRSFDRALSIQSSVLGKDNWLSQGVRDDMNVLSSIVQK